MQMRELLELYADCVPPSFDLDMKASLSNIDAISSLSGLRWEQNVAERKHDVILDAMLQSFGMF